VQEDNPLVKVLVRRDGLPRVLQVAQIKPTDNIGEQHPRLIWFYGLNPTRNYTVSNKYLIPYN
jgi:hypothetical protein